MKDILKLEEIRFPWSLKTFPEATPQSSLNKARAEIQEIQENLNVGIRDPEEYADVIMCLFDSAQRDGISAAEIMQSYELKIAKNKRRTWKKNPDNSYSHV